MAITKMPTAVFVAELEKALARKDGYIMAATGQDPKKWSKSSWWFAGQYSGSQLTKALYWREHADRVWDCNGLAEGLYKDYSKVDINTRARYNYSGWCGMKGSGIIPAKYRIPGAAVFWGDTAASIHHVAYLVKPVSSGKPEGDWYLIEARGVMYGVVRTKLLSRKPNYWGLMTKYFDYDTSGEPVEPIRLGDRVLENGCEGNDVKEMQGKLILLGYDLGSYGADGDFGDATEMAVRKFQKDSALTQNGVYEAEEHQILMERFTEYEASHEDTAKKQVVIEGGNCYVREEPTTKGKALGIAKRGTSYEYGMKISDSGWLSVIFKGQNGWVSGKYGKIQ